MQYFCVEFYFCSLQLLKYRPMKQLSKDYRMVLLATIAGCIIAYVMLNFSVIAADFAVLEFTSYLGGALLVLAVVYLYRLTMQLAYIKSRKEQA